MSSGSRPRDSGDTCCPSAQAIEQPLSRHVLICISLLPRIEHRRLCCDTLTITINVLYPSIKYEI